MILQNVILTNFKNYSSSSVSFSDDISLIYGKNGSGKTNLLDAIHYLSLTRSYFGLSDKYLLKHGESVMRVEGHFKQKNGKKTVLTIKYKAGGKKEIELDGKKITNPSELLGQIPLVFVSPDDINIVKNASKDRRDHINRIICQVDKSYLKALIAYNRLLRQKIAALKTPYPADKLTIDSLNRQMVDKAALIFQRRTQFLSDISLLITDVYQRISDGAEMIQIEYRSQLNDHDAQQLYDRYIDDEIIAKRVLCGTHKDDFEFVMDGKSIKKFGSQGQIKTFLYALKMGEFEFLKNRLNITPILILDDLFEKLDNERLDQMLQIIGKGGFKQVFISDTQADRTLQIFNKHDLLIDHFNVSDNEITKTS